MSRDEDGKGRDYGVMRFTSPESGKRGWLAVWGDAALPYPQATTDKARKRPQAMRAKLADGIDPLAAKRRDADAKREDERLAVLATERRVSVRNLFEQWQRVELAPHTLADGTCTDHKDGGQWVLDSFERRLFQKLGWVSVPYLTALNPAF